MNKAYTQQQLIRTVEDFMARRGQDLSGEEILKDGDRQYMIRMVNTTVVMNIDEQDVSL